MEQSKSKPKGGQPNSVRIIGGSMRGRKISFTAVTGLRPTLDQVRETLFNWLVADIHGANCLDLYAGSGAIGIEAISRGAKSLVMVDVNSQATKDLNNNLKNLSINNATVFNCTAGAFLDTNKQLFDLVFLDPPFDKGMLNTTLTQIKPHLAKHALVYVEQENTDHGLDFSREDFGKEWQQVKSKKNRHFNYSLICPIILGD